MSLGGTLLGGLSSAVSGLSSAISSADAESQRRKKKNTSTQDRDSMGPQERIAYDRARGQAGSTHGDQDAQRDAQESARESGYSWADNVGGGSTGGGSTGGGTTGGGTTGSTPGGQDLRGWAEGEGIDLDWDAGSGEAWEGRVTLDGREFGVGGIPGTTYEDGAHYVDDPDTLRSTLGVGGTDTPQLPDDFQMPPMLEMPQPEMPQYDMPDYSHMLEDILDQVQQGYLGPDEIMASEPYQALQGEVEDLMQKQMREGRADLAARGVLGEGSTPATRLYGDIAEQAGELSGEQMMQLLEQERGRKDQALSALMDAFGLAADQEQMAHRRHMDHQRHVLDQQRMPLEYFQTIAPYTMGTWGDRAQMIEFVVNNWGLPENDASEIVDDWLQEGGG